MMNLIALLPLFLLPGPGLSQLPNFWLAYMKLDSYDPEYRHQSGGVFTVSSGDPSWECDDETYNSGIWPNRDDVSGNKVGMRCDPSNDVGFPLYRDPLEVVEFNTGKFWAGHQSTSFATILSTKVERKGDHVGIKAHSFDIYIAIYSDRDYSMYDLEDHKTAQCYVNRSIVFDLDCKFDGKSYTIKGSTMFHCEPLT
ncbi:hypothetical protein GGS24DRAFT_513904 [Hypoxylon argillaceum]|nr:hypothetical protein GGS24DRAFT_513904 [Hypoxylon argillaceum]